MMKRWYWIATAIIVLCYWTFAGQFSVTEAFAMIIPVVSALGLSVSLDRVAERRFALRAPWATVLLRTSASLAKDSFKVGVRLAHGLYRRPSCPAGSTSAQPFDYGDASPREATRRALLVISVSAAPDRYVLDLAPKRLLSHSLVGGSTESYPEWPI
jgi:hypothetical protein